MTIDGVVVATEVDIANRLSEHFVKSVVLHRNEMLDMPLSERKRKYGYLLLVLVFCDFREGISNETSCATLISTTRSATEFESILNLVISNPFSSQNCNTSKPQMEFYLFYLLKLKLLKLIVCCTVVMFFFSFVSYIYFVRQLVRWSGVLNSTHILEIFAQWSTRPILSENCHVRAISSNSQDNPISPGNRDCTSNSGEFSEECNLLKEKNPCMSPIQN